MGKCIDYTWMGGDDRAVSVEAGVLMRRTPLAAAAEVGGGAARVRRRSRGGGRSDGARHRRG